MILYCIVKKKKFLIFLNKITKNISAYKIPYTLNMSKNIHIFNFSSMNNKNNFLLKRKLLFNKLEPRVYTQSLFLKGRGYKCFLNSTQRTLSLKIGFSHSIQKYIPNEISICTKKGEIFFKSYNYLLLKSFSLRIKKLKKVNMYKKKGLFFSKEIIRLKQVKKK